VVDVMGFSEAQWDLRGFKKDLWDYYKSQLKMAD
jgi:hypothetical protein